MHSGNWIRVAFIALALWWPAAAALAASAAGNVEEGKATYERYCSSCHGPKGEGNGPLAHLLTTPPVNLRLLSRRYGNPLPEDQIARFIDGRADVKAHGLRDMPVWGLRFFGDSASNIPNLVAFLQSIQTGEQTAAR